MDSHLAYQQNSRGNCSKEKYLISFFMTTTKCAKKIKKLPLYFMAPLFSTDLEPVRREQALQLT